MEGQPNIKAYVAAVDAASAELERLFAQAAELQVRMDQIHSVIEALAPLFPEFHEQEGLELNPTKQQVDLTLGLLSI